ncbi:DUF2017 domain-containing protein [Microbacterium sp. W1N]|uniref:DUF2017 domain-containing protein n=1 Tax=Microbacterium festucae TaxID=2977531 RepID=UPI0021BE6B33|nr:DUF2017 domain-containing protein [Microbacterium festucae]MCT9820277.1 DUF2017 domain-containing protein [Microbacterium festucae]
MTERTVVVDLALIEAAHLSDLTAQFVELLEGSPAVDPAIARLVPDAYPSDAEAGTEFRRLTEGDLLGRRRSDADAMLATLRGERERLAPGDVADDEATDRVTLTLSLAQAMSWLRTLSAVRLVLATRLGIVDEDDHDLDDPRFGVYDWLGYRLDGLVQALDA